MAALQDVAVDTDDKPKHNGGHTNLGTQACQNGIPVGFQVLYKQHTNKQPNYASANHHIQIRGVCEGQADGYDNKDCKRDQRHEASASKL